MTERQKELLRTLLEHNGELTAGQAAARMGVSVRTVHNYLRAIERELPGAVVVGPQGYQVDRARVLPVLDQSRGEVPEDVEGRSAYVLERLARSDGPVNRYELCDELFISTTTFQGLLGPMKRKARACNLVLRSRGDELELEGSEADKRRLLSELLVGESRGTLNDVGSLQRAFPSLDIAGMRDDVLATFKEHHYAINDIALSNLLLHLAISAERIGTGFPDLVKPDPEPQLSVNERRLTHSMLDRLEARFGFIYTPADAYQVALLLVSHASSVDYQQVSPDLIRQTIGEEDFGLAKDLAVTLRDTCDVDLFGSNLFVRFAIHIHNLMGRAKSGQWCRNPLAREIRVRCPLIYDVSTLLAGIICERRGVTLPEDEVGFLAMHLGSSLEEQREQRDVVSAVLLCPGYYDMGSSLAGRIVERTGGRVAIRQVIASEEDLADAGSVQLLISTIRLSRVPSVPTVVITPFLTQIDQAGLMRKLGELESARRQAHFHAGMEEVVTPQLFEVSGDAQTKGQVIAHICGRLVEAGYADERLEAAVLEREKLTTSSFGGLAIPHALRPCGAGNALYVYMSKRPIEWDGDSVRLVLLPCLDEEGRGRFYELMDPLTASLLTPGTLAKLLECNDCESFINVLADNVG